MSVTVAVFRGRVRQKMQEMDGRNAIGIPSIDATIRDYYISYQGRWPQQYVYTPAAGTISAASDSFALPTTSSAEYGPDIRVQLVSNGHWLEKVSQDEMTLLRQSQTSADAGGIPSMFAPYENASQQIVCWCFPRNRSAQSYNLFASTKAADFSATDISGTTLALSREAQDCLLFKVCAALAMNPKLMQGVDKDMQRIYRDTAKMWDGEASTLFYAEYARRLEIESIGRQQRLVP